MIYPDFYPFYATQGSPGFYNEEREQEKEFDLMRSYYPDTARRIQEKAEAQCQLLDYEGSRLYDEYPDRFMLYHICHQVKGQHSPKGLAFCGTARWKEIPVYRRFQEGSWMI